MIKPLVVCLLSAALMVPVAGQTKQDTGGGTKQSQRHKPKKEHRMIAVIVTTHGTIEAELYKKDAPKTVANFEGLAKEGYYDGIIFHRVVPGFVIQGGDSTGTGTGGRSIYGHEFADELNPETKSYQEGYKKGVLAMANHGPNTNSSQFFILLGDQAWMPHNYTIFGKVVKGMDVVEKIGHVELVPPGARDGRPKVPVVMKKVTVKVE
jgi:cyclophilin family peptidyl-prolyl cis-trans isomerase